jgi:hypothetical protein
MQRSNEAVHHQRGDCKLWRLGTSIVRSVLVIPVYNHIPGQQHNMEIPAERHAEWIAEIQAEEPHG